MATDDWMHFAAKEISEHWRELDEAGAQLSQERQSDLAGELEIAQRIENILRKHHRGTEGPIKAYQRGWDDAKAEAVEIGKENERLVKQYNDAVRAHSEVLLENASLTRQRDNWMADAQMAENNRAYWHQRFEKEQDARMALKTEFIKVINTVKDACDRDWKDEYPEQVATIAANAIFWRNEEIRKLRDRLDVVRTLLREFADCSPFPDFEDADGSCYFCGGKFEVLNSETHSKDCIWRKAVQVSE